MKQSTGNRQRKLLLGAVGICALLFVLIISNAIMVSVLTGNQSKDLAENVSAKIAREVDGLMEKARYLLETVKPEAEKHISGTSSEAELRSYLEMETDYQKNLTNDYCQRVFLSNEEYSIIPGQDLPAGYDVSQRIWYEPTISLGQGEIYYTSPYEDLFSGDLCITVSTLLSDNHTILGADFSLREIQKYVNDLEEETGGRVVIVNGNGKIIGCFSEHYLGKNVESLGVKYKGVMKEIEEKLGTGLGSYRTGFGDERFFQYIGNDWYILLDINSFVLYKESYLSLIRYSVLFLALLVVFFVLFVLAIQGSNDARRALESKAHILDNLSGNLRNPVRQVLRLSNPKLQEEYTPKRLEQIYTEADNLSAMLDNLFAYSAMISAEDQEKQKKSEEKKQRRKKGGLRQFKESDNSELILHVVVGLVGAVMLLTAVLVPVLYKKSVDSQLTGEATSYLGQVGEWTRGKESILSTFAYSLESQPDLLEDEEALRNYLVGMTKKDSDISHTYIGTEIYDWTMLQNDDNTDHSDVIIAAYDWYQGAVSARRECYFSGAYLDTASGEYCLTISRQVLGPDGALMAVVAVDYSIDSLTAIFEENESANNYAFLVNSNGIIINHPNVDYRLLPGHSINVGRSEYAESWKNVSNVTFFWDYDNRAKLAVTSGRSYGFSVVAVKSVLSVFSSMLVLEIILLAMYVVCLLLIGMLLRRYWNDQIENSTRLKQAAKDANRAAVAKTEFLAQMSHEIRTPINAVLGMNEMILRESNQREVKEYSSNIQIAGKTLLALINSILDFSKIEDGKMEIIPVNYQIKSLIDGIVEMTRQRAQKKNLELILDIDPELPTGLFGDDMRIHQVILNLLTNAIKYTREGKITLTIRLAKTEGDQCWIYVSVKDTGIGIKPEDMENLFVSFKRLETEKNRSIEGTGLGLSIVSNLLHMMDTELKVESIYGEGSDFFFEIQQQITDTTPLGEYDENASKFVETAEERFIVAPDARILVVDDNEMNRMVCKNILKRNQIKVVTAEGGNECMELLRKGERFDLIFMDHMMPDPDGVETLNRIIEEELLPPEVPVIVMTANAIAGAKESYLEAGFDDYMSKPIEIANLEKVLEEYLPPEKVQFVQTRQEEAEEEFEGANKLLERFPELDLDKGMENVAGDAELYIGCLKEIVGAHRDTQLEETLFASDLKQYCVSVHAIKGNLRLLGEMELGDKAYELELASRAENIELVKQLHPGFIQEFQSFLQGVAEWLVEFYP